MSEDYTTTIRRRDVGDSTPPSLGRSRVAPLPEVGAVVLVYLSRYLDKETAKDPFRSSRQAATCYYQFNHSKLEAIPLSAMPKDTTNELNGLSPH